MEFSGRSIMPASFEDPPPEYEKPPQPPPKLIDDDVTTIGKMIGAGCVAVCTCGIGLIFIMFPYGFFGGIGLLLAGIGLYAIYYAWIVASKGSEW
jgi:hypothetical protein